MRIIPKKIKVKNLVWKCYSMPDIIVALVMFVIIFAALTSENWAIAVIMGIASIAMFMPTPDGIFYACILENIKFIFAKKKYTGSAKNPKEHIDSLIGLKAIRENGLLEYTNGVFGRVVKIGQKNFGIEDGFQQNIDINYFANALKQLDGTQSADLVKIDRPITLDNFSSELFDKFSAIKQGADEKHIKVIKENVLWERIDQIDKLNNVRKKYQSDYYLTVFGKNEFDLENTSMNIASEINKSGLTTKILGLRDAAVFIKYSFSRNFDERDAVGLTDEELLSWVKPKEIKFHANRYIVDGTEATVLAVADYPLRVKNAWGAELFNIPNTKVVMHLKPVEKHKAIRRIDKCISEMETKQFLSEKASESLGAETHKETMDTLLDSLQTENEALLDVTLTVTAYNYLNNTNHKKDVRRAMLTGNFKPSTLYGLQVEGFKCANVSPISNLKTHERGINSSSLAAVFPFIRTYIMDEEGVLLGESKNSNYPFILNLWKRGSLYQNSNAMIIGKSGAGKSFFLKNLIANEWANGTRIITLDPEAEYINLTRNLGGNVIDVGNAKEGKINPFHIYKILTEEGTPADPVVTFNTHLKTLESFFKIVLVGASSDVVELINNLAVETYERKGITETTDCSEYSADDFPLFSDLLETLLNKDKAGVDPLTLRDMRSAELYLQKFVTGRYSDIWNAPSTLCVNADLIDFSFQSLFANKNNVVANAQMLLIFRFIEQEIINARELNKFGKNIRTLIICDEAHLFIDSKFPIALDFFFSMSKRIRKYNGAFIPATQNIADWNANEELRGKTTAILKNSQYLFIFKLSAPDMSKINANSLQFSPLDEGSGIKSSYVKLPNKDDYIIYDSKKQFTQSGNYSFYSVDRANNISNSYDITLFDKGLPEGEFLWSDVENGTYFTWKNDNYTATIDGETYRKDTIIRHEGQHVIMLYNGLISRKYPFSIDHHYIFSEVIPPTCNEQGYTISICTNCGEQRNDNYVDKLDHIFVDTLISPTCTKSGCILHTCSICDFVYKTNITEPSGHVFTSEIVHPASCIQKGERHYSCEKCGESYNIEIPSMGHQYEISDVETGKGKTLRKYTCIVCGDSYTQDLGNQYEKVTSYVEFLFNQYSPYMVWLSLSTAGVWSIVLGVMIIIARKREEKEKAKIMIKNYIIGLIAIFGILLACPYLVRGIAALLT